MDVIIAPNFTRVKWERMLTKNLKIGVKLGAVRFNKISD